MPIPRTLMRIQRDYQPRPNRSDLLCRRRTHKHVRSHGRRSAAGLGDFCGHGSAVSRGAWRSCVRQKPAAILRSRHCISTKRPAPYSPAETWKVKKFASASRFQRRLGDHDRRILWHSQQHARQLHSTRRHGAADQHQLGEIIFGGVGSGLYGMLLFVIVSVFVAGLMVGRTPDMSARRSRPRKSRWPCSPS